MDLTLIDLPGITYNQKPSVDKGEKVIDTI